MKSILGFCGFQEAHGYCFRASGYEDLLLIILVGLGLGGGGGGEGGDYKT